MADGTVEEISCNLSFGGKQLRYRHRSKVLDCDMNFSIYLPPQADVAPIQEIFYKQKNVKNLLKQVSMLSVKNH